MRTLVVTNDFPPRQGGIQTMVHELARRLPAGTFSVYAPDWADAANFDATQEFPVARDEARLLWPTRALAERLTDVVRRERSDTVWFGSAAPLGLLAPVLRRAGVRRIVATTHGQEAAWATLPATRQLLRRIARHVDVITYLGAYTRQRLELATGSTAMQQLHPGVDPAFFVPGAEGSTVRAELGLEHRPTIVCVSRLVRRKGQDMLIRGLPEVQRRVPGAALLIVGGGSDMPRLQRLAATTGVASDVIFTGGVPVEKLPSYYAAADVFAMPCRTRHAGLEIEGLGLIYLEASATGLAVVAGASGGAPDAVRDGITGHVVDGRSLQQITDRVARLLGDPESAKAMGKAGRDWVEREWQWDLIAHRLISLLRGNDNGAQS
ncbi:MAG: glycosyltransferase family 4 protein [Mycobacteriales bacterium]